MLIAYDQNAKGVIRKVSNGVGGILTDENPIYFEEGKKYIKSEGIRNSMLRRYEFPKINVETGKVAEVSLTTDNNSDIIMHIIISR